MRNEKEMWRPSVFAVELKSYTFVIQRHKYSKDLFSIHFQHQQLDKNSFFPLLAKSEDLLA